MDKQLSRLSHKQEIAGANPVTATKFRDGIRSGCIPALEARSRRFDSCHPYQACVVEMVYTPVLETGAKA